MDFGRASEQPAATAADPNAMPPPKENVEVVGTISGGKTCETHQKG